MDTGERWIIRLGDDVRHDEDSIGGKAAKLGRLARAGFRVPDGFFLTAEAYHYFVRENDLARQIRLELGRKPFEALRWEEVWDVALRIRSAFLASPVPAALAQAISQAVERLGPNEPLAVRSSAPGEDSASRSFAGLHESVVGVTGTTAVLDAVRVVWASLWSDAALLYRQELGLDPTQSRMAVVVQEMVDEDRSGVAFGRDPRQQESSRSVVEAVPGPCGDLVDGLVDPDRWLLDRASGEVLEWRAGERPGETGTSPILELEDLAQIHHMLQRVEALFQWPPDTEWTGRSQRFTLLQARPITTAVAKESDQREWYLSLRPGMRRLTALAGRVAGELIPELQALGERFAQEQIQALDDKALAAAIQERHEALEAWRKVYLEDFIPFAHGVRQLGTYYNDLVKPSDPYEFVGLLRGQRMVAFRRNQALQALAEQVRGDSGLGEALAAAVRSGWHDASTKLKEFRAGRAFVQAFEDLRSELMDVAYGGVRLSEHPEQLLATILEMARKADSMPPPGLGTGAETVPVDILEERLMRAAGPQRHREAQEVLAIGRLSWRLRDDDNLLVGRLESQLLRAMELAATRLRHTGRLAEDQQFTLTAAQTFAEALLDPLRSPVGLAEAQTEMATAPSPTHGESPRQLVGQPAAPGLATGQVRRVQAVQDLASFRAGEVLVCDAIQPTMTHLVPLASAIVERRGGMLIHGAIIAREMGIPCVNGVSSAIEILEDGDVVTVDGYIGVVTVGAPEFDLELG